MTTDQPMIFTSLGNVPLDLLTHSVKWEVDAPNGVLQSVTFISEHTANDSGNIVRREVHVMMADQIGSQLNAEPGRLN